MSGDVSSAPSSAMSGTTELRGRPSWSGMLRLSLVVIPVKAYPTANTSAEIHFNQLHLNCGQRVKYEKHCPLHGPLEVSDIQRAYQYAPNQYVPIEPEELEKIRPAKDKALVLERFIPAHQVDPVLYSGRTLYLLPDGMAPGHPYSVVAEALREGSKWAIGRVVLSGSRRLVVVRPTGKLLAMDLLHYPAQVRAAAAYETDLPGATPTSEEIHLARTLIDSAAPLNWADYRDTTTEELTALIQAKMAGQPLTAPAEEPVAVLQLLDALKQSVAAAEQKLPAVKEKPRKPKAPRRAG